MSLQKTIFFNQIIKISKCSINKSFRIDIYLIYPKIILKLLYFCTSYSVFRGVFSKTDLSESNYNFSIIKFKLKENWFNTSLKRDSPKGNLIKTNIVGARAIPVLPSCKSARNNS